MELIKIAYDKPSYGFGKPTPTQYNGVKFDDGKIAYQDSDGVIYTSNSTDDLTKALRNAKITPVVSEDAKPE